MDSFAYHLAWVILATQATLVLFVVAYTVGRVVGFAQFLWQEYVRSKNQTRAEKVYGRSHQTGKVPFARSAPASTARISRVRSAPSGRIRLVD